PSVVRVAAGLELRARLEHELELARAARGRRELPERSRFQLELHARLRAVRQHAVVEHAVPALLGVGLAQQAAPGGLDEVVAGTVLAARQQADQLDRALRAVERQDQRLHHAQRAAARARVAPGLEEVRARDVPRR